MPYRITRCYLPPDRGDIIEYATYNTVYEREIEPRQRQHDRTPARRRTAAVAPAMWRQQRRRRGPAADAELRRPPVDRRRAAVSADRQVRRTLGEVAHRQRARRGTLPATAAVIVAGRAGVMKGGRRSMQLNAQWSLRHHGSSRPLHTVHDDIIIIIDILKWPQQCSDAVGWAAGRASGL